MKKESKKRLMSLAIILVFALSSIAFVFSGFQQQQQQIKPLDSYVVSGDIDPQLEQTYINNGFTFLKLYYNSSISQDIIVFSEQAPATFTTPTGQTQLVVQKLESAINYATIVNINGAEDFYNLTQDDLFNGLCSKLVSVPPECAILGLNLTS